MTNETELIALLEDRLRPGSTVFCSGGLGEPSGILEAVGRHPEIVRGVRFVLIRPPGYSGATIQLPESTVVAFFEPRDLVLGESVAAIEFVPIQYSQICRYLRETPFDLALGQLAPATDGELSFGLCADFLPLVLESGVDFVAEVNAGFPAPPGSPRIPEDRCLAMFSADRAPAATESTSTEVSDAIGRQVATLIADGDCIETGIGSIPDAVLHSLRGKNDLGVHSGLVSDGVRELAEMGVVTGAQKTIDRGRIVTGFVVGSEETYRWAAEAEQLSFRDVSYTHDTSVMGQIDNFKAVNSAIEVDLFGQVNAETIRGRQISGIGGALDFMRGAARSRGGASFVALPATAASGQVSRIVAALGAGNVVTASRSDVDAVATEFGVAQLRGLSVSQRAEALAEIAAPEFRDELRTAAHTF